MSQRLSDCILAALLLLFMPACLAELDDRKQPLHLESDQVLIDDVNKTSIFTGNVRLTQGTMLIVGDKIIVVQDKDGFRQGTVYGDTATFRQKREGSDEFIEGSGKRIEYDTRAEVIDFYTQARVKRGMNELRGEHITYNIKTEVFQASNGITLPGNVPPKRVRAVLQPRPKESLPSSSIPEVYPAIPGTIISPVE